MSSTSPGCGARSHSRAVRNGHYGRSDTAPRRPGCCSPRSYGGVVTAVIAFAGLTSIALGRPLLVLVAENVAKLNPDPQVSARLAQPERRRAVTLLTTPNRVTGSAGQQAGAEGG